MTIKTLWSNLNTFYTTVLDDRKIIQKLYSFISFPSIFIKQQPPLIHIQKVRKKPLDLSLTLYWPHKCLLLSAVPSLIANLEPWHLMTSIKVCMVSDLGSGVDVGSGLLIRWGKVQIRTPSLSSTNRLNHTSTTLAAKGRLSNRGEALHAEVGVFCNRSFFFMNGPVLGIQAAVLTRLCVCLDLELAPFPFP